MSDPLCMADILLGRVGVFRSTAESIILELCEAQTKVEPPSSTTASTSGTPSTPTENSTPRQNSTNEEEALRNAIHNKLKRLQNNLVLLRRLAPEFDAKTKSIEAVNQANRNLMLEYHWMNQVQEMGMKAQNVYLSQLNEIFPRLEMLGDERCPPHPCTYLLPKSHKLSRVFDPYGEKQPNNINEMMEYLMTKNRKLKFYKQCETTRGGRRVVKALKCELNRELTVHLSFSPPLPESGPNGESGIIASPLTPNTPTSPFPSSLSHGSGGSARARTRPSRLSAKKQQHNHQTQKKKKGDMLMKMKLAAETATKKEMEELKTRMTEARDASREQELARAAGIQVTRYIERISVMASQEDDEGLGAWAESSHPFFRLVTLHARKALNHFKTHEPTTSFYHLMIWFGYYDKLYQTPCFSCKRILTKEKYEDWGLVPPSARDYSSGHAFHTKCLPRC